MRLQNSKDKEKILKSDTDKRQMIHIGMKIRLIQLDHEKILKSYTDERYLQRNEN